MRFFAIPSFSDLHVRVNLRGRERNGIVSIEEYDEVCAEVEDLLQAARVTGSGNDVVMESYRVRAQDPLAEVGPPADLVFRVAPAISVEHPLYGRMGTAPMVRSGEHGPEGWIVSTDVALDGQLGVGRPRDISATITALLGLPTLERCGGTALLPGSDQGR